MSYEIEINKFKDRYTIKEPGRILPNESLKHALTYISTLSQKELGKDPIYHDLSPDEEMTFNFAVDDGRKNKPFEHTDGGM
ncbi:hypothetical protein CL617_03110 [archaeon]|nr:hypothetical protein [archaeon]|tara:strand:+ start:26616 stop:26858 length:243 start_codon:yes stop_codon:yes gene_type:complete